jgi:hypothetical protein
MGLVPVLAVLVTALALYASRAVLDQVVAADGLVRVALLPPWQSIGGFLAVGILGLLWLDRRAVPRGTATAVRPSLGPILLPLFGLALLLLPYLPVLPDAFPALQVLAGPARSVIWVVTIAQLLWVLWQLRLVRADWLRRATLRQLAVAVGVVTALVGGVAASRLTNTALYPAGDEPHYLVIAQSLWRDGDLKIENNHARGDYLEYFPGDLEPHYLTRGVDGQIYSIHPIGMPVLIAPVYGLGGYPAVVLAFVLIAAVAAALMWYAVVAATNSAGGATFALAAIVGTSPFLLNTFAVYPEIPAALAVVVAFFFATQSSSEQWWRWLVTGVACASLPWLSTKYAPMSAALVAVALARIVWRDPPAAGAMSGPPRGNAAPAAASSIAAAALVVPYGLSLLGWFYFFYAIWGSPLPQSPYGKLVQTELQNLIFGAPGLLFDQEYGLLPNAPVYVLAGTGLWAMWRRDAITRRQALEVVVVFAALLGTVGAFRIWWGGLAAPSRPIASALLLLALPIAAAFREAPSASARRAAQVLLLWASIGLGAILLFAEHGALTTNDRDGTSRLLEYLSPRWPLWSVEPSFVYHEAGTALMHTAVWLAMAALAAAGVKRLRAAHPGAVSLSVFGTAAVVALVAVVVMPLLPLRPAWPPVDVRARARVPLLEEFDAVERPVAVEYTPFRTEPASAVVSQASFELTPGLRTEQQPMRVLHNGRFSLPAGSYRAEVEWAGARSGEIIGLQIGRTGNAWQTWPVEARPGERWSTEFSLPLDVSFVGLRGTPELERVVRRVRIVPTAVIDETRRPRTPEVIASSRTNGASIFYYDTASFPEEHGFWVQRARHTRVTIHRPNGSGPLILRVHSGPVSNGLRVTTFGWERTVQLQPQKREDIEVPGNRPLVTLELSAAGGFVPRELDSSSSDPRPLGVWIEVVQ